MLLVCPVCGRTQDVSEKAWTNHIFFGGHPYTCTCGDHIELHPYYEHISDPLFHPDRFAADPNRYSRHVVNPLARPRAWMRHRWKGGYYTNWNYAANRNWRRIKEEPALVTRDDIPDLKANILEWLDPDNPHYPLIIRSMTYVRAHELISADFFNDAWRGVAKESE